MTKDQLRLAAFVFIDELDQWKSVKFRHDNVFAMRSCGLTVAAGNEDEVRLIARQHAAEAMIKHYHEEMAKGN